MQKRSATFKIKPEDFYGPYENGDELGLIKKFYELRTNKHRVENWDTIKDLILNSEVMT